MNRAIDWLLLWVTLAFGLAWSEDWDKLYDWFIDGHVICFLGLKVFQSSIKLVEKGR